MDMSATIYYTGQMVNALKRFSFPYFKANQTQHYHGIHAHAVKHYTEHSHLITDPSRLLTAKSTHHPQHVTSSHMKPFLIPEKLTFQIARAVKHLSTRRDEFDAIAFCGMSGALIGPPLALALGKTMILVRKECDDSHAVLDGKRVEGDRGATSYVIADDFICSGRTARYIVRSIKQFAPDAKCLGLLEVQEIYDTDSARGTRCSLRTIDEDF